MDDLNESVNCNDCLKSAGCFKQLIPSELDFLNHNKTQIVYRQGETICKERAYASNVMFMADGLAKLYLECTDNNQVNIRILTSGEFIGLSSVYGDNIYHYSVTALVDSTICMISKSSFRKILGRNGHFASSIIEGYCRHETHLFNKIKSLGHKQMHGRLADTLLYLCNETFDQSILFSHLTRKDIADFAGLSTESTVRLLTELKNEKVIDLDGKLIKILDSKRLSAISKLG